MAFVSTYEETLLLLCIIAAAEKIKKIIFQSELSFPIDQRPFTTNPQLFDTLGFGDAQLQQRTEEGSPMAPPGLRYVQDKVFVGTDSILGFNVIENISGPQGSYLRHIAAETGAKVVKTYSSKVLFVVTLYKHVIWDWLT
jgi:hypothetical protein